LKPINSVANANLSFNPGHAVNHNNRNFAAPLSANALPFTPLVQPKNTKTLSRSRIIFVSNLPNEVTSEDLFQLFADCGPILHAIQFLWEGNGRFKGKAFVTFVDFLSAEKAVAKSGLSVRGRNIVCEMEKFTVARTRSLWVTNLPARSPPAESTLRLLFGQLGMIRNLSWNADERAFCGAFKGYVLIDFANEVFVEDCERVGNINLGGYNLLMCYFWPSRKHPQK
jgi:RNA recognition motif-containing protein